MTRDVWAVVRRRKWLLVLPFLLVFLLPASATLVMTKSYVSEGTVRVVPNEVVKPIVATLDATELDHTREPVDDALDTAELVVGSRTYLTEVALGAGLQEALRVDADKALDELKMGMSVEAAGPELMRVRYTGDDPLEAQRIVQSALEVMLKVRAERVRSDGEQAVVLFQSQVQQYSDNLARASKELQTAQELHPEIALTDTQKTIVTQLSILRAQLGQLRVQEQQGKKLSDQARLRAAELVDQINSLSVQVGASPAVQLEIVRLESERKAAEEDLQAAAKQLDAARLLAAVHNRRIEQDEILDRASLPAHASYGKAVTLAGLAFVLAAATAGSLVILAEYLDTHVRRPEDVPATAGIPVLAVIDGGWRSA